MHQRFKTERFRLRHIGEDFIVRYSDLDDRNVLGEPEDQRNHDEGYLSISLEVIKAMYVDKTFTVEDAVEHLGFGRFQLKLSLLTGCAWVRDSGFYHL